MQFYVIIIDPLWAEYTKRLLQVNMQFKEHQQSLSLEELKQLQIDKIAYVPVSSSYGVDLNIQMIEENCSKLGGSKDVRTLFGWELTKTIQNKINTLQGKIKGIICLKELKNIALWV
ncbi:unnamed protein product [Paramecium octaurelia]|uniref:Uncharacterized protein n=1 Tax=Paramecium octaurelia TaxID=43137 RepID=A0A8S1YCR8_PAROT|nr:unnamed protein product [Paramecium octaurelia]